MYPTIWMSLDCFLDYKRRCISEQGQLRSNTKLVVIIENILVNELANTPKTSSRNAHFRYYFNVITGEMVIRFWSFFRFDTEITVFSNNLLKT